MSNFQLFSLRIKKKLLRVGSESTRVEAGLASYLLQVKSKLMLGQGPSLHYTLFTHSHILQYSKFNLYFL